MTYLGMACLGGFVGGVLALGITYFKDKSTYLQLSVAIIATALSGTVVGYFDYLARQGPNPGLYTYPMGLLLALLWYYAQFSFEHLADPDWKKRLVGALHIGAVAVATIAAVVLVFPAAYHDAKKATENRDNTFYINQYHVSFDGIAAKVSCDEANVRIVRSLGIIAIENGTLNVAGKKYGRLKPHDHITVTDGKVSINDIERMPDAEPKDAGERG